MSDDEVRVTLRLPADLRDKLAARAEADGKSVNTTIITLLGDALLFQRKVAVEWPPIANWRTQ